MRGHAAPWLIPLFLLSLFPGPLGATDVWQRFEAWQTAHGVTFADAADAARRRRIFQRNDAFIADHNTRNDTGVRLRHNAFSHLTAAEFGAWATGSPNDDDNDDDEDATPTPKARWGFRPQERIAIRAKPPTKPHPAPPPPPPHADSAAAGAHHSSLDWVARGAVTPPRSQGGCGCCWAFAAVGAIEGAAFLKTGTLTPLSVQQVVDCSTRNLGCEGGRYEWALEWVRGHGGLCPAAALPFRSKQRECGARHLTCAVANGTAVRSWHHAKLFLGLLDDEDAFLTALRRQPLAVCVWPGNEIWWQFYGGGIIQPDRGLMRCKPAGSRGGHAVLAVGYGTAPHWRTRRLRWYWRIKNSWGTSWGEQGYARIERIPGAETQGCGILREPVYPVV
jgi:hypothetical protein